MSRSSRSRSFRFQFINPVIYLDALLFWSIYVSSSMLILWLLTSTAKNETRDLYARHFLHLKTQTLALIEKEYTSASQDRGGAKIDELLAILVRSEPRIMGMAVVRVGRDGAIQPIHSQVVHTYLKKDFVSSYHLPFLEKALNENEFTISDWKIFVSRFATFLTPAPEPVEYLYTRLPPRSSISHTDPEFLIIGFDAEAVQLAFYRLEEMGITSISFSILLGTLVAIFIRFRSEQRFKANQERIEALQSLGKRDAVLSIIVDAADRLLGEGDVNRIFADLLRELESVLPVVGICALRETLSGTESSGRKKRFEVIGRRPLWSIPFQLDNDLDGLPKEWKVRLAAGRSVRVARREAPARLRLWMTQEKFQEMLLVGMSTEGRLRGVLVALTLSGNETMEKGLMGALKLVADIFGTAYQQRQQEARLLESSKMEALGRMAGGVAHEFNNLLHIVSGNLRLARRESGSEQWHNRLDKVIEASNRGSQIVEQLLRATRMNLPDLKIMDLNHLVEKTLHLAGPGMGPNMQFGINLAPRLPSVAMDEGQIQQVILNLLLNARDAMSGNGEVVIRTGIVADQSLVYCEVEDQGSGIPDPVRDRLFEPFFTTKPPGQGTGLGLSTSRGILQQHQGKIEAFNAPSGGAVFRFYLPMADPDEDPTDLIPGTEPACAVPLGTVWIADDEPLCREVLMDCLREGGVEATAFEDGDHLLEALSASIHAGHPDVAMVITDWTMPGTHGVELIRTLRKLKPNLQIYITSGFILREEDMPDVDGIISKPFDPEVLWQALRFRNPPRPNFSQDPSALEQG